MKNLKKSIVFIFAVVVISATMFSSCKKSDDSAKATLMNHKWVLTSIETEDEAIKAIFDLSYSLVTTTYEFLKNDKLTITSKFLFASDTEEGTWSVSEDGSELTINGSTSEIIELTNKVLRTGPNDAILGDSSAEGYDYVIVYNAK